MRFMAPGVKVLIFITFVFTVIEETDRSNTVIEDCFSANLQHDAVVENVLQKDYRWTNATIPYIFDGTYDKIELSNILDAMEQLSKSTCLQFKERTTEKRHLIITDKLGNGCWADTGRQARGRTYMNLSRRCTRNRATILHELMHILGFLHQHARPDRGLYLCVLYENILPQPTALYNYAAIRPWTELAFPLPYDFESIMHYKPDMYSAAPGRLPTMIARRPWSAVTIGQREQLTVYDVLGIHFLYCV